MLRNHFRSNVLHLLQSLHQKSPLASEPIWQAARATTAAPTYFPPAWVTVPFPPEWYVDGGVTQNNPSPFALKEGKELWKTKRCLLVSVGTGIQKCADLVGNKKKLEVDSDPRNAPSIVAGPVESHRNVEGTLEAGSTQAPTPKFGEMKVDPEKVATMLWFRYYRFNVQNGMDDIGLEEWQNWHLMVSLTRNYLDSVDVLARLTECAKDLLHPPGFESM